MRKRNVTAALLRGDLVSANPKGNLFVDRQVKLEYHENGTLKSLKGSSASQGGKVAAAVIKRATFAAATAICVPLPVPAGVVRPRLAKDPSAAPLGIRPGPAG
ncbi:hypothetical protein [Qipengyuania sp.]|uniref:hypothetical protein n=1 Tax=Qipengyuania sp. TaxID=2004515 RepID=UPI0035150182